MSKFTFKNVLNKLDQKLFRTFKLGKNIKILKIQRKKWIALNAL